MDKNAAQQERSVGRVRSEKDGLNEAIVSLDNELDGLVTMLTPVLQSQPPTPTVGKEPTETNSDCPLAHEIAGSRRTVERFVTTIMDLKDRLEV